jgi:hypothetical protein
MKNDKPVDTSPRPALRPLTDAELRHATGGVDDAPAPELDANGRLRKRRYEESNEQG